MEAISIYSAVKSSNKQNIDENDTIIVHALKIPRNYVNSLCDIQIDKNTTIWKFVSKKVTCNECLSKLKGKKFVYANDNDFMTKIYTNEKKKQYATH